MRVHKSIVSVLAMLPLVGLLTLTGCGGVLPATLEEKLASSPPRTIIAAAMLYQNKARELKAEAVQYETAVSKIGPSEDTKGFRRGALRWPRKKSDHDAKQMQALYATHSRPGPGPARKAPA